MCCDMNLVPELQMLNFFLVVESLLDYEHQIVKTDFRFLEAKVCASFVYYIQIPVECSKNI